MFELLKVCSNQVSLMLPDILSREEILKFSVLPSYFQGSFFKKKKFTLMVQMGRK